MKCRGICFRTAALLFFCLLLLPACTKTAVRPAPSDAEQAPSDRAGTGAAAGEGRTYRSGADFQEETLDESARAGAVASADTRSDREKFEIRDIHFAFDSAKLTAEAQEILRQKADWLRKNPRVRVRIEGHCDDRGTNEYNLALGESRAENAKEYLVTLGIEDTRLTTVSYGEERPLVRGTTEEARAQNRRAHFEIVQ